jgi:hypothetical protein
VEESSASDELYDATVLKDSHIGCHIDPGVLCSVKHLYLDPLYRNKYRQDLELTDGKVEQLQQSGRFSNKLFGKAEVDGYVCV